MANRNIDRKGRPIRLPMYSAVLLLSLLPVGVVEGRICFAGGGLRCRHTTSISASTLPPRPSKDAAVPPSPNEMRPAGYSCLRWGGAGEDDKEGTTTACAFPLRRVDGSPAVAKQKRSATVHPIRCFGFSTASSADAAGGGGGDRPIQICVREIPFSTGKLAGTTWFAGVALAQYLAVHSDMVKNKSVLELGSGVGLVGIMAAKLGARKVFLTDFGADFGYDGDGDSATAPPPAERQAGDMSRLLPLSALENIRFNANMNGARPVARVEHLDWNDFTVGGQGTDDASAFSPPPGGFDLVVGSDLVYDEDAAAPLIATLKHFLGRSGPMVRAVLMLPGRDRKALPLFLEMLRNDDAIEFDVEEMALVDRRAPEKELLMVTVTMRNGGEERGI